MENIDVPLQEQPEILREIKETLEKLAEKHGIALFAFIAKEIHRDKDQTHHMAIGVCRNMTTQLAESLGETIAEQNELFGRRIMLGYSIATMRKMAEEQSAVAEMAYNTTMQ